MRSPLSISSGACCLSTTAEESTILKTILFEGQVAKHDLASLRVLEKCGFTITGEEVGDFILTLRA